MNAESHTLPELDDATMRRIENDVFAEIALTEPATSARATDAIPRRRRWITGLSIAAAFVIGALIAPAALTLGVSGTPNAATPAPAQQTTSDAPGMSTSDMSTSESSSFANLDPSMAGREVITSATARVQVDDIPAAASAIEKIATNYEGYVESTSLALPTDPAAEQLTTTEQTDIWVPTGSSIVIRVPSTDLRRAVADLAQVGEVVQSSTGKQDVTTISIDLAAQVTTLEASIERLTALMSKTNAVGELVDLELAISDRQAQLTSAQQQLASIKNDVAMSTLQVNLEEAPSIQTSNPNGFGTGLLNGWNGLVASVNALIVVLGFVLPWVALGAIVWLTVSLARRRRRARTSASSPQE